MDRSGTRLISPSKEGDLKGRVDQQRNFNTSDVGYSASKKCLYRDDPWQITTFQKTRESGEALL